MNDLMKLKIKGQECEQKYDNIIRKIIENTTVVENLVIFDENRKVDKITVDFDTIKKIYGDKTGYEVACNEIRIDFEDFCITQMVPFLIDIGSEFERIYNKKIVLYMQYLNDCFELRFHTLWKNEDLWLNRDLNIYDIPVICYIPD